MTTDSLPAGPELDRLVAEKVMGFGDDDYIPPGRWHVRPNGVDDWFKPSTNIAHAWEVVEKMSHLCGTFKKGDGFFHVTFAESADHSEGEDCNPTSGVPDDYDGDADLEPWSCHVHVGAMGEQPDGVYPASWDHGSRFCCKGPTAQVAICRAALKAVAS